MFKIEKKEKYDTTAKEKGGVLMGTKLKVFAASIICLSIGFGSGTILEKQKNMEQQKIKIAEEKKEKEKEKNYLEESELLLLQTEINGFENKNAELTYDINGKIIKISKVSSILEGENVSITKVTDDNEIYELLNDGKNVFVRAFDNEKNAYMETVTLTEEEKQKQLNKVSQYYDLLMPFTAKENLQSLYETNEKKSPLETESKDGEKITTKQTVLEKTENKIIDFEEKYGESLTKMRFEMNKENVLNMDLKTTSKNGDQYRIIFNRISEEEISNYIDPFWAGKMKEEKQI